MTQQYLAGEIIDDAGHVREGERYLLQVDVRGCCVEFEGILGNVLKAFDEGGLARAVEAHEEELFVVRFLVHFYQFELILIYIL